MDWVPFVILQVMVQPSLSVLFTVEAEQNTYKSEYGGDVVMGCRFQPRPSHPNTDLKVTWHWIKPGSNREVYQMNNGMAQPSSAEYQGRVNLFEERLRNGWARLKLSNLQISDSGTYQCLVQTAEEADYKTITLSVVAPYKSVTKCIEKTAEGHDVLLTCQSEGYPETSVVWKDGRLQELKHNTTTVQTADQLFKVTSQIRVSAQDKNNYTCDFANGPSAIFQIPDEVCNPQVKNKALWIILSTGAVMAVIIVVVLMYRRRKGSRILSTRNLLYDGLDWPCPAAACLQIKKEHEEERIMVCTDGMEENLVGLLKAHYSDVFSTEWRCLWDNFNVEELPRRLQNSDGQVMKLQALHPEAGETLFLEGPPESRKMTIAQILVSSWTEGRTDLLDLSTLQLLVYVNCSAVEGDLIQEIMTQCSLINKSTENELRTVLTRASGEALLLLDGYREENKTFDESLKRFLSERGGCRVLVMASPANCHSLKEACGTGEMLRLEAQTV
uniref:B7-H1/DC n=1 Tax=Paralichthys olivaceus TaxID=8255 RepID=A0A0P0EGD1_PAROL|nr:B7-H1/DC [Paralichthys olivaceus]